MRSRTIVLTIALGIVAALAAVPALSFAQQTPPPPPMALIYGQVSGGSSGQPVVAFVRNGGTTTMCGIGTVMNEPGVGTVYAVDVERNSSVSGCGASGRQVRLYFGRVGATPGRFATQQVTLTSNEFQAYPVNVTLASSLSNRIIAPSLGASVTH